VSSGRSLPGQRIEIQAGRCFGDKVAGLTKAVMLSS
jgi:hypothetical protein